MSHEIRTPMTSAIGLLNLVLDTELLPKQKAYLEMARVSTVVMHNLLSDILDLSKIEAGRLHLEHLSFNPRKVILSVIDLQHFQAEEKTVQLSSVIAEDVPLTVVGDPNRLRQIILNLVSNAIKFTKYGEVELSCRREVDGDPEEQQVLLHFSVRDTGIGIEHDKIDLIFEAFTQADSSTTRRFGGVGLGLNICSKLVTMMGGSIWVESEPGQGSTFQFTCRFGTETVRVDKDGEAAERMYPAVAESFEGSAGTVLVVEDDTTNQWVIREILEHEGYAVVNAADGATALKEFASRSFDLMFLDLRLPGGVDGYEVVRQIRAREALAGSTEEQYLPIIALTGMAGEGEKQRCLQSGMNDFLAKPFAVDQFITKARKAIRDRVGKRRLQPREKAHGAPNVSVLAGEIFNENDALRKASDNREVMLERIGRFLRETPQAIEKLRKTDGDEHNAHFEQEVNGLKEKAMEIGGTSLADELFSLLMQIRKKQNVQSQIDNLSLELERFRQEPRIRQLLQSFIVEDQKSSEDEYAK